MTPTDPIQQAEHEAVELALQNGIEELMAGAADPEVGPDVLADLLAHELTAMHRLAMRLSGAAQGVLDWSVERDDAAQEAGAPDPAVDTADLSAARLAGVASRLMESMRQGLVALARCRPAAEGEGVWVVLSWLDGRCSDEELQRRIAARKAAKAANDPEPGKPAPSPQARELRALAAGVALQLAQEAKVKEMAALAADERRGVGFLARLFAHELGAEHGLIMRLAGSADLALDRAVDARTEPATALRLAGVVARLGDRFRRGVLTLQRLARGPGGGPGKVAGMVWGGLHEGYKPGAAVPANDAPDPAAAPAATAGHGVHRSFSAPTAGSDSAAQAGPLPAPTDPLSAGHGVDRPKSRRAA
jgi:hypothetical protein